ncbi:hypothetical protein B0T18DRAFT_388601 [Schizothecium vesticola]|uniref:Uncharacterized protein n=1 Tax=Schizothecium vesticola TaxID=314040 RepID=A0AA40F0A7_9PEZI|nr:hypothetical protein B0T18DRAFT_388601 [Schizothecium vesticola]
MVVYIAAYGANSAVGGTVKEALLPEYEIVHAAVDLAAGLSELPALIGGDSSIKPASGLGTNASGGANIPQGLIVGGSVPADELAQITAAIKPGFPIIQITKEQVAAAGGTGPDPALIAKLIKEALAAKGL